MPVTPGRKRRADSPYAEQAAQLARRLRELRQDAGMTQEKLAAQAGIATSTLRKIEAGAIVEPGYFTICALMGALGVPPAQLGL